MKYTKEEINKCLDFINSMKEDLEVISEMIDDTYRTFRKFYNNWNRNFSAVDPIRLTIQDLKYMGVNRYDRPKDLSQLSFYYDNLINCLGAERDLSHASGIIDDTLAAIAALNDDDIYDRITRLSETYEV